MVLTYRLLQAVRQFKFIKHNTTLNIYGPVAFAYHFRETMKAAAQSVPMERDPEPAIFLTTEPAAGRQAIINASIVLL